MAEVIKNTDIDLSKALVFDAHLLKTFRACEEKYRLFDVEHVVTKDMKAAPSFGIAMHEGVADLRECKKAGMKFPEALEHSQKALLEAYKKHMPPEYTSEILQDDLRGPKNALRLFTGYAHHYEPMGLKFHQVEVPFAMLIGEVSVPDVKDGVVGSLETCLWVTRDAIMTGIMDCILEMQSTLFVNDLKTTGWNISEEWLEGFKMDQGLIGYTVAARELLGVDTHSAVVHAMWVKGEAKDPKRAKPLDEYFHTKELYWDDQQLEEWHSNTLCTIQKIAIAQATNQWQRDYGQNCGAFGGCEYRKLCSVTPKFRDKMKELEYTKGIWSPLEDERMTKLEG